MQTAVPPDRDQNLFSRPLLPFRLNLFCSPRSGRVLVDTTQYEYRLSVSAAVSGIMKDDDWFWRDKELPPTLVSFHRRESTVKRPAFHPGSRAAKGNPLPSPLELGEQQATPHRPAPDKPGGGRMAAYRKTSAATHRSVPPLTLVLSHHQTAQHVVKTHP